MSTQAILYVPSDTPEAMIMATRHVAGVPLIVRGIMTLAGAGFNRVTLLIAEAQRAKIERFLSRFKEQLLPGINIISYDEPYGITSEIVWQVTDDTRGRLVLINANLIFEARLAKLLHGNCNDKDTITFQEGVHPIPILEVPIGAWKSLEDFTATRPRSIESCLGHLKAATPIRIIQKPPEINTFLITRHRDRAVAEKFLTESIRHSTDGPVARYLNKRISLPISLFLSKLWVSPNAITVFNIVIGLFSGVFIADGSSYRIILLGAALFQIASIIDGCDGEVAKLTFRCSKFGQYIDSLSDTLTLGSLLAGLIAGYWRHTHSHVAFSVGAVMIVTTIVTLFWMVRFLKKNTQSASLVTFDKQYLQRLSKQPKWLLTFIKYGKYTLKKDMFSFMIFVSGLAGIVYWWLFITTLGSTLAAITLTYLNVQGWLLAYRKRPIPAIRIDREGQTA